MVLDTMDTSSPFEENFLETLEVSSSTASSINVKWSMGRTVFPFIEGFRVHYQKVASTYVQYGPKLGPSQQTYEIENLVADTYYKVCLVVYRNDTNPMRECVDASTTNWQLPVSIGSSIGAILALSMIVLIVLLSRCQIPYKYRKRKSKTAGKYDTMSSNFHDDHYEFSETATHGNEDEFTSEMDHEEYGLCEGHEVSRHKHISPDRSILPNGLPRNHVHPHTGHVSHHRNSLGRIHVHGNGPYHFQRPCRAYSIQADSQSILLSQAGQSIIRNPRKHSILATKEWHSIEEPYPCSHPHVSNLRRIQKDTTSVPSDFFRHSCTKPKSDMTTVCSPGPQEFAFFDEQNEKVSKFSTQSRTSKEALAGRDSMVESNTFSSDTQCDDMSALGAVGGFMCNTVDQDLTRQWESRKSIEMASKSSRLSLAKGDTFDEHTV